MKILGELFLYALVLSSAMFLVSSWQTRDMLDNSGDVRVAPITLPTLPTLPTRATRATLQSEQTLLAPDPRRNTLIYFFAPWCSICRASINNLDGIDEEFTRVVVVALDYDSTQSVQDFIDDVGLNRPVLLGNSEIQAIFRIKGYPSYYILDRDFQVISRDMGYTSEFGLRARAWRAKPDLANKHN